MDKLAIQIPTLEEVMSANPRTIELNAPLAKAEHVMREMHILHLPVTELGKLRGILGHRDIYTAVHRSRSEISELTVKDAYVEFPYCVDVGEPLLKVVRDLRSLQISSALVLTKGSLCGIVTLRDCLRVLDEMLTTIESLNLDSQ